MRGRIGSAISVVDLVPTDSALEGSLAGVARWDVLLQHRIFNAQPLQSNLEAR
jgi:hypothetical protein